LILDSLFGEANADLHMASHVFSCGNKQREMIQERIVCGSPIAAFVTVMKLTDLSYCDNPAFIGRLDWTR